MPKSDHEVELTINGTAYDVSFLRSWKVEWSEYGTDADGRQGVVEKIVEEDEASDIRVNGIRTGYFVEGFRRQVLEAVDKWLEDHEPQVVDNRY